MELSIDCSLSNSEGVVFVDEEGANVPIGAIQEGDTASGQFYHPGGEDLLNNWLKDNTLLVPALVDMARGIVGSAVSSTEDVDEETVEEANDSVSGEDSVPGSDEDSEPAVQVPPEEQTDEDMDLTNARLLEAGVPESLTDELLGVSLDSPEAIEMYVSEFGTLTNISGIGPKSEKKILNAIRSGN